MVFVNFCPVGYLEREIFLFSSQLSNSEHFCTKVGNFVLSSCQHKVKHLFIRLFESFEPTFVCPCSQKELGYTQVSQLLYLGIHISAFIKQFVKALYSFTKLLHVKSVLFEVQKAKKTSYPFFKAQKSNNSCHQFLHKTIMATILKVNFPSK